MAKTSDKIQLSRGSISMSQAEFASAIGVSEAAVQHWEQGRAKPYPKTLRKISELTGKPLEWFSNDPVAEESTPEYKATPKALPEGGPLSASVLAQMLLKQQDLLAEQQAMMERQRQDVARLTEVLARQQEMLFKQQEAFLSDRFPKRSISEEVSLLLEEKLAVMRELAKSQGESK